jgi:hypothetical protein
MPQGECLDMQDHLLTFFFWQCMAESLLVLLFAFLLYINSGFPLVVINLALQFVWI